VVLEGSVMSVEWRDGTNRWYDVAYDDIQVIVQY
jgi:hypothetical protein